MMYTDLYIIYSILYYSLYIGTIYFSHENYDEAGVCYDKALRYDVNLQEQIKIKTRQLNTGT